MDDRWRDDFAAFLADLGPRPSTLHSLDRIDVNGHYAPGNCRWATPTEQANNTRVNVVVEIEGRKLTLKQAARAFGVNYSALHRRVRIDGEAVGDALAALEK